MHTTGTTVRLVGSFFDLAGNPTDPDSVTVRVYDHRSRLVHTGSATDNRVSPGVFEYDWTIPAKMDHRNPVFYEFEGLMGSKPSVGRKRMDLRWEV
jgi:hypothetical protein